MGRYRFYVPAECASGKGMKSLPRNFSVYVQLQCNHLLFIAWVKPLISWALHIWVPTYHRQNRHFVMAAALCILRSALCSLRFSLILSLMAYFPSLESCSSIFFAQETMTYTRATMKILFSVSSTPYAYFSLRIFPNFQTKMAWKLISLQKAVQSYQAWYFSDYKPMKSILSELCLQATKGPAGRDERSLWPSAHDLGSDTGARCPARGEQRQQHKPPCSLVLHVTVIHQLQHIFCKGADGEHLSVPSTDSKSLRTWSLQNGMRSSVSTDTWFVLTLWLLDLGCQSKEHSG